MQTAGTRADRTSRRPPQQPPITFRAEVNYVEVDARVLDAQGKFVTDLKPDDFQVFEDGKPQKVTAFSLVNIPVERAERPLFAAKPIEPDVRNNLQGADGRIYLIVLDDLHTNALRSQRTKAAARHVHRALHRRQRHSPRSSTPAAASMRARTSPTASGCCCRRSTSSWAASCARRR